MKKSFASTDDTSDKNEKFEIIDEGVYALTAEGDPNVGAIEGEDFLIAIEARATPASARKWINKLREHTDKPIKYLVLTHYHAVRTLGAEAFNAEKIITSSETMRLINERGKQDWESEYGRMPRLFTSPESIKGLTYPTSVFNDEKIIDLGGGRGSVSLNFNGKGHTSGDITVWHEKSKTLFSGDLIEADAALYTGDAYHFEWSTSTLDRLKKYQANNLVGGRGTVVRGTKEIETAIEKTRGFLQGLINSVGEVFKRKGTLKEAYLLSYEKLSPIYGKWPIFDHCLPFDVQRIWDEYSGIHTPVIWTAERDRHVWKELIG